MGSAASQPVKSAAGAAARRQYPKQPVAPPRSPPSTSATGIKSPTVDAPPQSHIPTPTRTPPISQTAMPQSQGPTYHSQEQASTVKSEAIDLDGRDPHFAASLRSIGPVTPNPTMSHSSTFGRGPVQTVFPTSSNPALLVMTARQRISKAAQEESARSGDPGFAGRQFLDSLTIQQALSMRDQQGLQNGEIERRLRLKKGLMDQLGKHGLVSRAT